MRISNIGAWRAAILTAVVGASVALALAIGGGSPAEAGPAIMGSDIEIGEELPLLEGHPYADGPVTLAAARKKKPSIKHYISEDQSVEASGSRAAAMKCPRRMKVIDGGFLTSGGIIPDALGPLSPNRFVFSVLNTTDTDGIVAFTITCSKGNG